MPSHDTMSPALPGTQRLLVSPLSDADADPLATLLWHEQVYRHIGGLPGSPDRIALGLRRAMAGPPAERAAQRWLNYGMRLREGGALIGRLEATVHDGLAEVAFLMAPAHWGHGYATEGLHWLHAELARLFPGAPCWATTVPANTHCQRLLARCGYTPVAPAQAPDLMTYDEGDLVFRRLAGA